MESLVETLEPFSTTAWRFEEQVRFVYSVWLPIIYIYSMVLLIINVSM
jgi:hypothetical protein